MKIVKLTAENIKRLVAVEITPDGNTVVIAGKNGQGKTSVLDSIWFALGGGPAARGTSKPIRDGQDHAQVTLDLGELRVTRTWTDSKSQLRVESPDGATYKSPQSMLDALVGRLSFDPLAFAQQDERTQLASLIELVELPFDPDELARARTEQYERRTEIGREAKQLEGQLASMPKPDPKLPSEEISITDLLSQHRAARQVIADNQATRQHRDQLAERHARAVDHVAAIERSLKEAQEEVARLSYEFDQVATTVADMVDPDLEALDKQLAEAEDLNAQIRLARYRITVETELEAARAQYNEHSGAIAELDGQKAAAIAAAKMPIDGLAFDDTGVTYRGMPFKQCSAAEQLRVSLAMAMSMNPRIRVIRITDGSLLDSDNMRLIEEMAAEHDFQVWLEKVDESGQVGVVIEDGAVASVNGKPVAS